MFFQYFGEQHTTDLFNLKLQPVAQGSFHLQNGFHLIPEDFASFIVVQGTIYW